MAEKLQVTDTDWYQTVALADGTVVKGEQDCGPRWHAMTRLHENLFGKYAVDLGAAEGFFTCRMVENGAHVVAVEYDETMVERLRSVVGSYGYDRAGCVEVVHMDAQLYLTTAARGFADIVLSLNIIHHVPGPLHHIAMIADLLRPGGVAYVEVPNSPGNGVRLRKRRNYVLERGFLESVLGRTFSHVRVAHDWRNTVGNPRIMFEVTK